MNITDSVLTSIKKLLGIAEEYEHFDADLIMHINSVFSILTQLGVGPSKGFMIEDKSATWKDFISDESKYMLVKSYMHLRSNFFSIRRLVRPCWSVIKHKSVSTNGV